MDIEETTCALKAFLKQDVQKVLMLKGAWGVGKTYYWKQFVADHYEDTYSYVSLFGVETLKEIRNKILIGRTSEPDKESTGKLQKWMEKGISYLKEVKGIGAFVDPLADAAQEFLIKNQLVCLDDLERRHKNLSLSQVLGFVSNLTEEKDCRVVLIVNEEKLINDDSAKEDLNRYREKVIDVETTFSPQVLRNAQIAFPDNTDLAEFVAEIYQQLAINNIRVMKQCKWCMEQIEPLITECEKAVRDEVRAHISILTAARYESNFGLTLDDLEKYNDPSAMFDLFTKDDVKKDPKLAKATWLSTQFLFRWQNYDLIMAQYFRDGYLDVEGLKNHIKTLNEREKLKHIRQRMYGIWRLYNANFQVQADKIEPECLSFLDECSTVMSLIEIEEITDLLKSIGRPHKGQVKAWKNQAVSHQLDQLEFHQLIEMLPQVTDAELRKTIENRITEFKKTELNPMSVIRHMIEKSSWGQYQIDALKSYSDNEFEDWLRRENDPDLLKYLQEVLHIFRRNADKDYKQIYENLRKALLRIAKDSDVDRLRVKAILKIETDNTEGADE